MSHLTYYWGFSRWTASTTYTTTIWVGLIERIACRNSSRARTGLTLLDSFLLCEKKNYSPIFMEPYKKKTLCFQICSDNFLFILANSRRNKMFKRPFMHLWGFLNPIMDTSIPEEREERVFFSCTYVATHTKYIQHEIKQK